MTADPQQGCLLLSIPTETLEGIMFYLPATSLARLASCARAFRRLPDRVARDRVEQACGAEDAGRYRYVSRAPSSCGAACALKRGQSAGERERERERADPGASLGCAPPVRCVGPSPSRAGPSAPLSLARAAAAP
jgi:hypothetical protein